MVIIELTREGFKFSIDISIFQNLISLQCSTDINNNIYYLQLSLKYLHSNYLFFQRCNSLNEAYQLMIFSFSEKGYVKEINNSKLLIGIKNGEEDIIFNLEILRNRNINNNINNQIINSNMNYNINIINNLNKMNNNNFNNNNIYNLNNTNNNNMNINIINNNINNNFKKNNNINNLNNNNDLLYFHNNNNNSNSNNNNINNNLIDEVNNISTIKINSLNNNLNSTSYININSHINNINNGNNFNKNLKDYKPENNNSNEQNNINNNNIDNKIYDNSKNNIKDKNNLAIYNNIIQNIDNNTIVDKKNSNFSLINIKILQGNNNLNKIEDLYGLLKLCLIKKLSEKIENINGIEEEQYKDILQKVLNNLHFTGINNIMNMIKENKIINILAYSQYLNSKKIFNSNTFKNFINKYLDSKQKEEMEKYWKSLSSYRDYNSFFEKEFLHDLKICKFDYSVISINILESDNYEKYEKMKKECSHMKTKIVYHTSKITPFSNIISSELNYSKKTCYGKGYNFTDIIDYIPCYLDKEKNDINYGKIINVNKTFSFIASEIFYDEKKINNIENIQSLYISIQESNNFNYSDKKVEPNGINHIRISIKKPNSRKNTFIGNEYVISENYQIFPLYTITLKRNEYCVLWRDPNFESSSQFKKYLEKIQKICLEKININFYYEASTEKALHFLARRKHDKIILVTSIGKDLSGKRFIEIARKIFGFDIMVLFFSNNTNHFEWIQNFQNCLYTNKFSFFEEYITNFNEEGLKLLKNKVEEYYKIKLLSFSFDFLLYPNYKNEEEFSNLDTNNYYLKNIYIKNEKSNKYLSMTIEGKVIIEDKKCPWVLTILNNEITAFSNGFYLDIDGEGKEDVVGFQYMKNWNIEKAKSNYYFINPKKVKNNILSIEGGQVKVNKGEAGDTELFQLIDI